MADFGPIDSLFGRGYPILSARGKRDMRRPRSRRSSLPSRLYWVHYWRARYRDRLARSIEPWRLSRGKMVRRMANLTYAFRNLGDIPGAIVEAGVGRGFTLAMIALLRDDLCPDRQIFAYDSFMGFPSDATTAGRPVGGQRAHPLASVRDTLERARVGIDDGKIQFFPGYFSETCPEYGHGSISFLHIDVDLGKSYRDVLENLFPHVAHGGLVLFDEYDSPSVREKWPDAKPAIDSYLADKSVEDLMTLFGEKRVVRKTD